MGWLSDNEEFKSRKNNPSTIRLFLDLENNLHLKDSNDNVLNTQKVLTAQSVLFNA